MAQTYIWGVRLLRILRRVRGRFSEWRQWIRRHDGGATKEEALGRVLSDVVVVVVVAVVVLVAIVLIVRAL